MHPSDPGVVPSGMSEHVNNSQDVGATAKCGCRLVCAWTVKVSFEVNSSPTIKIQQILLHARVQRSFQAKTDFRRDIPGERCVLEKGTAGQESAVDHVGLRQMRHKNICPVPVCGIQLLESLGLSTSHLLPPSPQSTKMPLVSCEK